MILRKEMLCCSGTYSELPLLLDNGLKPECQKVTEMDLKWLLQGSFHSHHKDAASSLRFGYPTFYSQTITKYSQVPFPSRP